MLIGTQFDCSAATTGSFGLKNSASKGRMICFNDSSYNIDLTFPNGDQAHIPARSARLFTLEEKQRGAITWTQTPNGALAGAPSTVSLFTVEFYEDWERILETYPLSLARP
jgi:hypothetical protein